MFLVCGHRAVSTRAYWQMLHSSVGAVGMPVHERRSVDPTSVQLRAVPTAH
jgi:hypothetical protein